jgi:formylglycine-generating enzyme required for sulfatase activity
VFRGSAWNLRADYARCAHRDYLAPGTAYDYNGFRPARSVILDEMVLIPGGSFTMGRTSGDTDADAPPTTVTVSPFYIQQTETTKAQWDEVRTWGLSNGYTDLEAGAGKASNHPVQGVTWWDVVKWCNARSEKEGLTPVYTVGGGVMRTGTAEPAANWIANGYRLPTEAEWEKAARGGVEGKRFPWGTDTISHAQANYYGDSSYAYDLSPINNYHPTYRTGEQPYTSPVGSFEANGYGLYDMSGNVWECCWDWYGESYYTTSNGTTDPRGAASGSRRVYRGGSWIDYAIIGRAALRYSDAPGARTGSIGFRPVRSASPRPDAMVGRSLAFMGGANVYASARSQQVALVSQKARPVFGYVSAANRGGAADRIALRSIGVSRFFAIDYRNAQGSLVTAAVKAGTYLTPELEPDDPADWLEAKITPVKRLIQVKNRNTLVTLRKVHTVLIQANSVLDPAVSDGVSIRVETR